MVVLLRKYFWLVNLLTIALCAFLAAKAMGKLVEARLPAVRYQVRPLDAPPLHPDLLQGNRRDIKKILTRNIFCSTCQVSAEVEMEKGEGEGQESGGSDTPVKSNLSLSLIATLVSQDPRWCFAAITDPSTGKTNLHAIGSPLSSDATVTDIVDRRVYLLNRGRNEYLELGEEGAGSEGAVSEAVSSSAGDSPGFRQPDPLPEYSDIAAGIRRVGGTRWEIQRSALNKVLNNTTRLARSARIVPSVMDGKPNGFRLFAVRPGSLYSLLGFFNGDTVNAINGHAITTPDRALEVYSKMRNASHLSITYTRRGVTLTHEYDIR